MIINMYNEYYFNHFHYYSTNYVFTDFHLSNADYI